ncbi:dihydropteroate synthase [Alkalilimnicola sp. S0819]|uniref:dihydropteroate synthase n=1 Tax=Alkalilimnicola sp. S0819 TaxID=2613922 RepID=UPI001261FDC6|nr:dihydropteroate synthase [Alkalilimnicola sp. S0819]KAB7628422.1 dihydropteroate synthase [Alkalilimnicola sp. S0819]MPQ15325.1 dihydropteroate synthase [Alkalilimnicola sp. S0819]
MTAVLDCGGKPLDLSRPQVMGILNITPDSFSDGGVFLGGEAALERAHRMVAEGAAIIDIGGESTRPGAAGVSVQQELDRVLPVIEALAPTLPVPLSVDTTKPEVMAAAVDAGAGLINDVLALRAPGALEVVAALSVPVCLMHMQGEPRTMQRDPRYDDVLQDVMGFLRGRLRACEDAGIARERLLLDPGFGFGKNLHHNCRLLKELASFQALGAPLLVGLSRKSMLGAIVDRPVTQRLPASLAAAVLAAERGASIIRVHDVADTVQALAVVEAVAREGL